MDILKAFIAAIPNAATSPLALIAYLATLAAWVTIAFRVSRFRELMRRIEQLPESDRLRAIQSELGWVDVPKGLTGEQYLRKRIHTFAFVGLLVFCGAIAIVGARTLYEVYQQAVRTDNHIEEVLGKPTSAFMSAVNTLSNGQQMVAEAAAEIRPPMSSEELSQYVDRLVLQRLNAEQINRRLAEVSGAGRLRAVNGALSRAAGTVDEGFAKLAACFRDVLCRRSSKTPSLCERLVQIQRWMQSANEGARRIRGLNFNTTGGPPLLGGGSMDIDFSKIESRNVEYLLTSECA